MHLPCTTTLDMVILLTAFRYISFNLYYYIFLFLSCSLGCGCLKESVVGIYGREQLTTTEGTMKLFNMSLYVI